MAKRNPPKANQFKPGQSGNPEGRPKLPPDIVEARRLNRVELERILNRYIWMTKAELSAAITDAATPLMEVMIASLVARAAKEGDQQRLGFVLDRLGFKAAEPVQEHNLNFHLMPRAQVIQHGLEAIEFLKAGEPK